MSGSIAGFAASASSAGAALTTQLGTLAADLAAAGDVTNASTATLAGVIGDATAAASSAIALEAAHEGILGMTSAGAALAAGTTPSVAVNAILVLLNASTGAALAFDAANRLTRLQDNLMAIGT